MPKVKDAAGRAAEVRSHSSQRRVSAPMLAERLTERTPDVSPEAEPRPLTWSSGAVRETDRLWTFTDSLN